MWTWVLKYLFEKCQAAHCFRIFEQPASVLFLNSCVSKRLQCSHIYSFKFKNSSSGMVVGKCLKFLFSYSAFTTGYKKFPFTFSSGFRLWDSLYTLVLINLSLGDMFTSVSPEVIEFDCLKLMESSPSWVQCQCPRKERAQGETSFKALRLWELDDEEDSPGLCPPGAQ